MRKKIACILLLSLSLCGCQNQQSVKDMPGGFIRGDNGVMNEWVSPDGVHYWVIDGVRKYGIAPRYDSDGKLIIDKVDKGH